MASGGRVIPLFDALSRERGTEVPDEELPAVGRIRRRLMRGETLGRMDVGTTEANVFSNAVMVLEGVGFTMERIPQPMNGRRGTAELRYRITNLTHELDKGAVTAWAEDHTNGSRRAGKRRAAGLAEAEAKRNANGVKGSKGTVARVEALDRLTTPAGIDPLPLSTLPDLGSTVRITGLVTDGEGNVTMMFRNATDQWITTLQGAGPA